MIELLSVINVMIKMGMSQAQVREHFAHLTKGNMDAEHLMGTVGLAPGNAQALKNFERALPKLESAIVISFLKAESDAG